MSGWDSSHRGPLKSEIRQPSEGTPSSPGQGRLSERARTVSKAKQATTFRDGPSLPGCKAAGMVGFDCTHRFGLLMVGMSPRSACLGSKQVKLHFVRALNRGMNG